MTTQQVLLGINAGTAVPTADVLWWKMNDGSGTTITADVGPNGTTDGTWTTGPGGTGTALSFNGSSQDASSNTTIAYGATAITVTFWLNLDTTSGTQVILESSSNYNSNNNCFILFCDAGTFEAGIQASAGYRAETVTAPSTGTWVHIAAVYDNNASGGNGDIKLYFNGVEQTLTVALNTKSTTGNFASQTLYVMARGASSLFTSGDMDDLRVYAGELSAAQILAIYNAGAQ